MLPIVTYPSFIETVLPRFSPIFTKPQLRHFAEYLTGLVVSPNKTVSGMNAQFLDHTNQSSKNHFLTQSNWDDQLLTDEDYLVQKGYGWMLKEISKTEPIQVFDFVMERKAFMPRTSLRYAIEKLPPELRQKAMEK